MSIERDLELEMQLRRVEERIAIDPILSVMIQMEQDHDLILSRIRETYFQDFLQKYQIQITICEPGDVLIVAGLPRPVSCYQFFHSELLRNGTPLAEDSRFYNIDNKLGNISYIGVFTYYSYSGSQDLYIELDSRYIKNALGYPSLLSDRSQLDRFKLPYDHSYAKCNDDRLVSNSGKYVYASKLSEPPRDGFSSRKEGRSFHFMYKTGNKGMTISRHFRTPFALYPCHTSSAFLRIDFCRSPGSVEGKRPEDQPAPKFLPPQDHVLTGGTPCSGPCINGCREYRIRSEYTKKQTTGKCRSNGCPPRLTRKNISALQTELIPLENVVELMNTINVFLPTYKSMSICTILTEDLCVHPSREF